MRRYVESPKPKLVSYSHSPLYQETLYLSERQQSGEVVRIVGLVVGTHAEYPDVMVFFGHKPLPQKADEKPAEAWTERSKTR